MVICGRSEELQSQIEAAAQGDKRFHVQGYTTRMHELMKLSDLFIGKPGGLTTAEALTCGLPMVIFTLQPALGGVAFDDETLLRLIEIPQVVAIKEALFDAKRFREIVNVVRSAPRRITVLTGNDNFIWESYLLGAEGALLGACAVTTRTHVDVYEAAMRAHCPVLRDGPVHRVAAACIEVRSLPALQEYLQARQIDYVAAPYLDGAAPSIWVAPAQASSAALQFIQAR